MLDHYQLYRTMKSPRIFGRRFCSKAALNMSGIGNQRVPRLFETLLSRVTIDGYRWHKPQNAGSNQVEGFYKPIMNPCNVAVRFASPYAGVGDLMVCLLPREHKLLSDQRSTCVPPRPSSAKPLQRSATMFQRSASQAQMLRCRANGQSPSVDCKTIM